MSQVPHELAAEFPEFADRIRQLKQGNAHFARLLGEYDELNRKVYQAETNVAPMEELAEMELRKRRMALKDELYRILAAPAEIG
ncbi:YdcH family protein [Psychromarinibacter sp. S121]|uniref:YdcH family protein n=1 Tax=Psychromarinibacter sp. S121 TaxID=3415127 RepID=UPI003C7D1BA5